MITLGRRIGFGQNPYQFFLNVPGCELYFDARNPLNSTTQPTNGTAISTLYDLTSQKNNYIQSVVAQYPTLVTNSLNGLPGINFNSANSQGLYTTSDHIMFLPSGSWSIYYVIKLNSTSEYFLTDSQGLNYRFIIYSQNNSLNVQVGASNNLNVGGLTSGSAIIISIILDATGNVSKVYQNGTQLGSSGAYAANGPGSRFTLGIDYGNSFAPLNGVVYAYLIYTWAHDTTTRQSIETKLGNIWGINAT